MALTAKFQVLNYINARVGAYVKAGDTQAAMYALNALEEALFDVTVGPSQVYKGHDHAAGGGASICRGNVFSFDGGVTALYLFQPTAAGQRMVLNSASGSLDPTLANYQISPGLPLGSVAKAHLVYSAKNSGFTLELVEALTNLQTPRSVRLELPPTYAGSEDEVAAVVFFDLPIVGGEMNSHAVFTTNVQYNGDAEPELRLYRVGAAEVDGYTTKRVFKDPRSVIVGTPSNQEIFRWWCDLNDELAATDEWGDSELWFRLFSKANAMFEAIGDTSASPTAGQKVKGHDHTPSTVSGYQGGRPLARNTQYIGGKGRTPMFTCDVTSAGTYVKADSGNTAKFQRSGNGLPLFKMEVSQGLDSTGSPPSSAPYLTARVFLRWVDTLANVSARFYNSTTGEYSAVTTTSPTRTAPDSNRADIEIDFIPCQSGTNNLDLEITSDRASATDVTVEVEKVVIQEVAGVGGSSASSGNVALGGVR